jgi:acetone carboxylase gamma subunit
MKIVGVEQSPKGNIFIIECECGHRFRAPTNRWKASCHACRTKEDLHVLMEQYKKDELYPDK